MIVERCILKEKNVMLVDENYCATTGPNTLECDKCDLVFVPDYYGGCPKCGEIWNLHYPIHHNFEVKVINGIWVVTKQWRRNK